MPLTLPWLVAPRDLAAGDVVTLGRVAGRDLEHTAGEDAPAGTLLGYDPATGTLRPVTAANTRRTTRRTRAPTSPGRPVHG